MLYAVGIYDYAIPIDSKSVEFYSTQDEVLSKNELIKQCDEFLKFKAECVKTAQNNEERVSTRNSNVDFNEGFFDSGALANTSYYEKIITNASSFIPTVTSTYRSGLSGSNYEGNCVPTAAANLLSYYKEKRGFSNLGSSRQDIYDRIVVTSGWDYQNVNGRGMNNNEVLNGMSTVLDASTYAYTFSTYTLNTNANGTFSYWSKWRSDLDANYPVLTSVKGYEPSSSSSTGWDSVGHRVVAIGYREYDSGQNYFRVLDGWYPRNDRYILYSQYYFNYIGGIAVKVYR